MSTIDNILASHSDFVSASATRLTTAHADYDAIVPIRTKTPADFDRMRETASLLIDFITITSRRYNTLEQYSKALALLGQALQAQGPFRRDGRDPLDNGRLTGFVKWVYETKRRAEIIDREDGFDHYSSYAAKRRHRPRALHRRPPRPPLPALRPRQGDPGRS
jgi:hypothetical protein